MVYNTSRVIYWYFFWRLGMSKYYGKIGDKFGRLEIKELYWKKDGNQNKTYAKCLCVCGNEYSSRLTSIVQNGDKASCGCYKSDIQRKRAIERNYKHGKADLNNRLYSIWCGMKARCYIKSQISYKNYGARGIRVCDEWRYDYPKFEEWALTNGYNDVLTIDRLDANKDYSPDNCKWETVQNQQKNKRNTVSITAWGETKVLADWGRDDRCRIDKRMIRYRIDHGWSPENAISTPPLRKDKYLGQPKSPTI